MNDRRGIAGLELLLRNDCVVSDLGDREIALAPIRIPEMVAGPRCRRTDDLHADDFGWRSRLETIPVDSNAIGLLGRNRIMLGVVSIAFGRSNHTSHGLSPSIVPLLFAAKKQNTI